MLKGVEPFHSQCVMHFAPMAGWKEEVLRPVAQPVPEIDLTLGIRQGLRIPKQRRNMGEVVPRSFGLSLAPRPFTHWDSLIFLL